MIAAVNSARTAAKKRDWLGSIGLVASGKKRETGPKLNAKCASFYLGRCGPTIFFADENAGTQPTTKKADTNLTQMIFMNDKKILDERGEKYGPMGPMWKTIGRIQWEQFTFMLQKCGSRQPTPEELGQLAALNMNAVKMVRSLHDPKDLDHGIDGRNYWTISENLGDGKT